MCWIRPVSKGAAARSRVRVRIDDVTEMQARELSACCPTGALSIVPVQALDPDERLRGWLVLDHGRCILCGICIDVSRGLLAWGSRHDKAPSGHDTLREWIPIVK